jgi:hypothetical protein
MEDSPYFVLAALGIVIQTMRVIADLREENTKLKLEILESDIHYSEQDFAKMLRDAEGEEINWEQSGIGSKKRYIERLHFDVKMLQKKKRHFLILFY